MKILTLGLGAFGFAINKVLGENNLIPHPNPLLSGEGIENSFYAFELNKEILDKLKKDREHPYFFSGYKLPENIEIIDNYDDIIGDVDLLIIAIPAQFISSALSSLENNLKQGVTILNLAKGIDVTTNKTISQLLETALINTNYNYSILSGGMIASEVVEGKPLGADLGIVDFKKGEEIKALLENKNLKIKLREDIVNIELYGSLKNIAAILVGYYEGKGYKASTTGFKLLEFYDEMKELVGVYGGNKTLDFSYFSLGGDLVATCFGKSRNRYFGRLLGEGKDILEVLEILKIENKHAEGYETLKAVYKKVEDKEGFEIVKFLFGLVEKGIKK